MKNLLLVALITIATPAWSTTSSRVIQYQGPMPLLPVDARDGQVELTFELYRSPTGGTPFWEETRTVDVRDTWVEIDLGNVVALPDEAFTSPFRFLSIWHRDVEFKPRKQVVSVAYLALPREEYGEGASGAGVAYAEDPLSAPIGVEAGATVTIASIPIEIQPQPARTWLEAEQAAQALGRRLPTSGEWYAAVDADTDHALADVAGHYEWVVPWVYEPQIHARMNELYRGKPQACYYTELSPENRYPFRMVAPTEQ
jgi:hypothetical protein